MPNKITIDGNEAAAKIAHLTNEVIAIYPITPASPMGEFSDDWSSIGKKNIWGSVPEVIEMQSEAGAAGTVHGALQGGALTTTFTASQGLLLMIPNMYKIAGELTPGVIHVAARSLATQALSIFGDHSDVMACRATGYAMLCSNSVQEVHDFALISQLMSLASRIPVVHFFDGFRTSHEVAKIEEIDDEIIKKLLNEDLISDFRNRALSPENPVVRGTSQNPDVYFQARETVNKYYQALPNITQEIMDTFKEITNREYKLYQYYGDDKADRIIVLMGSGAETAEETVDYLNAHGNKVGILKVRLFRPFDTTKLISAIPKTVQKVAVLDRTKEPGADGEPLFKDVVNSLYRIKSKIDVVGGRYGLSSKEFTPAMVKSVFDELKKEKPKNDFTVGIFDDVTNTNLKWDKNFITNAHDDSFQALFYGLGSDGTVSANKNTIKIIGEETDLKAQGYFVYDSKKSGAITVSHLRFGKEEIKSSYLIESGQANFIGCHQPSFLEKYPNMLRSANNNSVFLLNTPKTRQEVWQSIPKKMQKHIIKKQIQFYIIDAYQVAENSGMGKRINTIMQTCFFGISGVLPADEAIKHIKNAVDKTYGKKSKTMVKKNFIAIENSIENLKQIKTLNIIDSTVKDKEYLTEKASDFVKGVTIELIRGHGDLLPVSVFPDDGSYPLGTTQYEKRALAIEIPVWDEVLCTQCGKCPMVCPHAAIRSKVVNKNSVKTAPASFKAVAIKGKDFEKDEVISYQVAPEDCTGCGLCVDICPIRDKSNVSRKALNMESIEPLLQQEKENWNYFLELPEYDRKKIKTTTIKGSQILQPLFEFSGACVGCGETPYVKLISQLFGDRLMVANATGCSSIYGGNLPTTPWAISPEGRGPAWSNSLFEDNAEFGLGMRLAVDQQKHHAKELLLKLKSDIGGEIVERIINASQETEEEIINQRSLVSILNKKLKKIDSEDAKRLLTLSENLCKKSVWIVGGDGWAYDIGYGGVDHVLASGKNVNILVLDTEVYSNTGGQKSKATPTGAVAKFASSGKSIKKKDLAQLAMSYEDVYVARVAYGAKDMQTLRAFLEAEAYSGVSIIIAYSPCIAHGMNMEDNHKHQRLAVRTGHWILMRYDPSKISKGKNPLKLDSKEPDIPYSDFAKLETRFSMLWRSHPDLAKKYLAQAQNEVNEKYFHYKQLAEIDYGLGEEDE